MVRVLFAGCCLGVAGCCLGVIVSAAFATETNPAAETPLAEAGRGICVSAELIYSLDDRPTPQCHASTIAETESGMVAAWFAGTHEKNPDVGIRVARHDGDRWLPSAEVANGIQTDGTRYPCWNPVLFQPSTGPLMLFYKVGPSPSQWWGMLMTSADDGVTWSSARKLGTDPKLGQKNPHLAGPVKNKPIELRQGEILCPSSTEHRGWRVHFELTRDGGKTWEVVGPINDASKYDAIQPSVLTYGKGRMQILCRTKQQVVASSWSEDGGQTWSGLGETGLPNPNAGTDAVTLRGGRQLLVYNHTKRGGDFPAGREMLNVAISKDGKAWEPILTLEKKDGSEFSYPAVIQASDGKVHITYTYLRRGVKHVVLDLDSGA
ncbi:MAG: exo-alpha-sialidase [Planctomycetaceae bacterium]|nr:exo-alpha-sialidase [Planctomycetaceae bacterium]